MSHPARIAPIFALAGACALMCACANYRLPEGGMVDDPALRARCVEALEQAWPPSYRIAQKVRVEIRGRRIDLLGYLAVRRGYGYRAVAMGEMGGKFLDILWVDGAPSLLLKPEPLPRNPIEQGVAGDILLAFDPPAMNEAQLYRDEADRPVLVCGDPKDCVCEAVFAPGGGRPVALREAVGGRWVRTVRFDTWRESTEAGRALPERIVIRNRRWGYTTTADLVGWRGAQAPDSVFRAEAP